MRALSLSLGEVGRKPKFVICFSLVAEGVVGVICFARRCPYENDDFFITLTKATLKAIQNVSEETGFLV